MFEQAGYWPGDSTLKKKDYDTKENAELVDLNRKILSSVGFDGNRKSDFRPEDADFVRQNADKLDPEPFSAFVEKCNRNQPWVWKDPRLTLTIRWWRQFLDLSEVVFPIIYRDTIQGWTSAALRYSIRSPVQSYKYRQGIRRYLVDFTESENADYLEVLYEDLIQRPEQTIERLNHLASSDLTASDFYSIFRGTPGRRQHGAKDIIRATLLYLANFRST
jgi:hypothetical protein